MPNEFPVKLEDGYLVVNNTRSKNSIDLPIDTHGEVELQLVTAAGEELQLTGKHITSIEKSELEYVEDYNV